MRTRSSLLPLALTLLLLSGCASLGKLVATPPTIQCGNTESYCPAPVIADGTLGQTEQDDSENRSLWAECAAKHRALVDCLGALRSAGVIEPKR